MQEYLPENLKSKVTNVRFDDKCAYHKEIQGELLETYQIKNNYSAYKIDIKAADYQFLSNTGYVLEKRKDRPSFRPEVAKVLENFAGSYHNEILYQKQIKKTKSELCL